MCVSTVVAQAGSHHLLLSVPMVETTTVVAVVVHAVVALVAEAVPGPAVSVAGDPIVAPEEAEAHHTDIHVKNHTQ